MSEGIGLRDPQVSMVEGELGFISIRIPPGNQITLFIITKYGDGLLRPCDFYRAVMGIVSKSGYIATFVFRPGFISIGWLFMMQICGCLLTGMRISEADLTFFVLRILVYTL